MCGEEVLVAFVFVHLGREMDKERWEYIGVEVVKH
jgi:hypothetical protein